MISEPRTRLWYWLSDHDVAAELDIKLDRIDIEIDGLQRIRYEETKTRLGRLGIDTTNFRPPPPLSEHEQRCTRHLRDDDDDIEALVIAAKESPLDRLYREHVARTAADEEAVDPSGQLIVRRGIGQVLSVR